MNKSLSTAQVNKLYAPLAVQRDLKHFIDSLNEHAQEALDDLMDPVRVALGDNAVAERQPELTNEFWQLVRNAHTESNSERVVELLDLIFFPRAEAIVLFSSASQEKFAASIIAWQTRWHLRCSWMYMVAERSITVNSLRKIIAALETKPALPNIFVWPLSDRDYLFGGRPESGSGLKSPLGIDDLGEASEVIRSRMIEWVDDCLQDCEPRVFRKNEWVSSKLSELKLDLEDFYDLVKAIDGAKHGARIRRRKSTLRDFERFVRFQVLGVGAPELARRELIDEGVDAADPDFQTLQGDRRAGIDIALRDIASRIGLPRRRLRPGRPRKQPAIATDSS